jgi:two-component system NarL family response regulator
MSAPKADAPIRVLVVDDHPLMRDGIAIGLADEPDIQLVAEAADGRAGIEAFRKHRPDVTLMDLQMPDMSGIEAMQTIRSEFPDACIIVLTTYRGDVHVTNALRSGARAFLLKSTLRNELRDTIRAVHAGRFVLSPEAASALAEHASDSELSQRELQVLRGAVRGQANKTIGAELGIAEDTVKVHMKSIFAKLGVRDRTQAAMVAIGRGLVQPAGSDDPL